MPPQARLAGIASKLSEEVEMHTLQRVLGAYAMVIALTVALNFILTPFFFDNDTGYPIWDVLDFFMAVAILIVFVASCMDIWRLCHAGDEADLKRYLSVNVAFFATGVLLLLFFSNWAAHLMKHATLEDWTVCAIIDAILPPIVGAGGLRLWRTS